MRVFTDEMKATVVETLTNCEKSFSIAQSRQFPPGSLAAPSLSLREQELPIIRKELLCTGCESKPIKGNLYLMLSNLFNDNLLERVICQQCFDH